MKKYGYFKVKKTVTPRMRRVSRNIQGIFAVAGIDVTPRMRRVSRNFEGANDARSEARSRLA